MVLRRVGKYELHILGHCMRKENVRVYISQEILIEREIDDAREQPTLDW